MAAVALGSRVAAIAQQLVTKEAAILWINGLLAFTAAVAIHVEDAVVIFIEIRGDGLQAASAEGMRGAVVLAQDGDVLIGDQEGPALAQRASEAMSVTVFSMFHLHQILCVNQIAANHARLLMRAAERQILRSVKYKFFPFSGGISGEGR